MVSIQEQDMKNSRDKKLEIQIILEKLRQRDSLLFSLAEEEYGHHINKVSASESVVQARKAINIIKNAGIGTPVHPKCPGLMLCHDCHSSKISVSQNSMLSKYLCLDCGKIWISGVHHATSPGWVENVWSVA